MKWTIIKKFSAVIIPLFIVAIFIVRLIISDATLTNTIEMSVGSATETINQFKMVRGYYTKNVVSVVKDNGNLDISITHQNDANSIPLPATMMHDLSKIMNSKGNGNKLKLYSNFPFPNRANRVLDDFGKKAIDFLTKNPTEVFFAEDEISGQKVVRVAIGDFMIAPACVSCHNTHPQTPKRDWKLGDLRGVLEVISPIDYAIAQNTNLVSTITIVIIISLIIIMISLVLFIRKSVSKPIGALSIAADNVANGNFSEILVKEANDEIGDLTDSFGKMTTNLQKSSVEVGLRTKEAEDAVEKAEESKIVIDKNNEYLMRSAKNLLTAMDSFSQGNLTVTVVPEKDNDDIGKLFNGFNTAVGNIKNMIEQVKNAVEATASASSQISSSAEEMAAGAQEQSAQTNEVAAAMEEMARTIVETASNATNSAEASKSASEKATEGTEKLNASKEGMQQIVNATDTVSINISSLANKTDQIGEIAQVIDDIADQTNLLALNAAIEAARAGEQGRGFAVVADEVRKLAERTTKATKEIAETIKAIQVEAKDANSSMEEAGVAVKSGLKLNDEVGTVLTDILDSVEDVTQQINQVATASEQQSATAEQVSSNIESINNVANESASVVQQIATASEDLNRLTENLSQLVEQFNVDEVKGLTNNHNNLLNLHYAIEFTKVI
jgi:methyl-accepting chemotaxis protein